LTLPVNFDFNEFTKGKFVKLLLVPAKLILFNKFDVLKIVKNFFFTPGQYYQIAISI